MKSSQVDRCHHNFFIWHMLTLIFREYEWYPQNDAIMMVSNCVDTKKKSASMYVRKKNIYNPLLFRYDDGAFFWQRSHKNGRKNPHFLCADCCSGADFFRTMWVVWTTTTTIFEASWNHHSINSRIIVSLCASRHHNIKK